VQLASAPKQNADIKVLMTHDPPHCSAKKSKQISADIPQLGEEV
jgi:hypothetical protein